jgi:RND superfamily putative drug exporter
MTMLRENVRPMPAQSKQEHVELFPQPVTQSVALEAQPHAENERHPRHAAQTTHRLLLCFCLLLGILAGMLLLASRSQSRTVEVLRSLFTPTFFHDLLITGSLLVALALGSALAFLGLAFYIVHTLICPQKKVQFIPLTPLVLDLPAEEIAFPAHHGEYLVRGLYIARPEATTTILISPGYRRTLADVLGMCKHLWAAGHNVLAFEYYGHGTAVGTIVRLGYREVNDFLGAVSYARQRAPHTRIGVLGYSMGGAVSIMGSARTPEVEAVVADSAFASQWSAVEMAVRRTLHLPSNRFKLAMKLLRQITDGILAWRAGYHFHQVEPQREIARLSPRPVLLIHGLDDTIVPPDDAVQLYQAAGKPRALWQLAAAEHIKAYFTDPSAYVTRITAFFDRYLKQSAPLLSAAPACQEQAHEEVRDEQDESVSSSPQRAHVLPIPHHSSSTRGRAAAASQIGLAYGHLVYRFRWAIIALWTLLLLGSLPLAGQVQTVLHNSGYSISGSESQTVDSILTSKLHQPATQILAVFQSSATPVSDPAYQHELHDFMTRVRSFAHVSSVIQAGVGKDGRSALVVIGFNQDKDTVAQYLPAFRRLLPAAHTGPARVSLTGDPAVSNEIQLDTQSDTEEAEFIALPLTLLVLLFVFGSVVAGLMPLILAAVTVAGSLAIIYLLALHIETNIFIQSLASIIGLGLSIDYSLLLIRRFREELEQGDAVPLAVAHTVATAGEAILFSATTVMVGFAGLLLIGIQIMTSFGIGGITVASMAALAALTLLPALLSVLGPRINALSVPLLRRGLRKRFSPRNQAASNFWHAWALFVMKRPFLMLTLAVVVLVGLGWPALALTPGLPGASALPAASQARRGSEILAQQFPTLNQDPIDLVVQTADGSSMLTAQNLQRLAAITQEIVRLPHVTEVVSLTQLPPVPGEQAFSEQQVLRLYSSGAYQRIPALRQFVASTTVGNTTLITIRADTVAGTHDDEALIDRLRSLSPQVRQGVIIRVGGARAINLDFDRTLYGHFFRALVFILLATYLLLLVTFRSIVLPFKAILMNVLSISGAYGALVFIFQQGHFENLLGFTATGFLDRFIPILLFCVLFGLSMDYEVFLLTRMREEWLHTGENRLAVAQGLEKTGGIITSAAFLFVIVSGSFTFTQLIVTKELGLGITVAVLVDATVIRLLLVPATMQLLGKWNWWFPRHPAFFRVRVVEVAPTAISLKAPQPPALIARRTTNVKEILHAQRAAVEQTLMQMVAQVAAVPQGQLHRTAALFAYVSDSHALTELLSLIEQHLHVHVEADEVFDHPTLHRLATLLLHKQLEVSQGSSTKQ